MTVIAVRKYDDRIELAADSQATWGKHKKLDKTKIIQKDGLYIGFAGAGTDLGLLQMFILNHNISEATEKGVLEFLSDFNDWAAKRTNNKHEFCSQLIIIKDFNVFMTSFYFVDAVEEFSAAGCGMFLALGAMELGATPVQAVNTAIKYDTYCGGSALSVTIPLNTKKEEKL